jgi:hypothetical protein
LGTFLQRWLKEQLSYSQNGWNTTNGSCILIYTVQHRLWGEISWTDTYCKIAHVL